MDKDIRDYLKYYIGHVNYRNRYIDYERDHWTLWSILTPGRYGRLMEDFSVDGIQIELRKLESMTKDEAIGLLRIAWPISNIIKIVEVSGNGIRFLNGDHERDLIPTEQGWVFFSINQFHYLLSRGFDLFGLINAGLAIDKATIKS